MVVNKKKREKVLRLICEFEEERKKDSYIPEDYLVHHGFSKEELLQVLTVLEGMGYIKYRAMPRVSEKHIALTDKGKCYFETKKDDRSYFIKKNIIVPIIVSIVTTIATLLIISHLSDGETTSKNKPLNDSEYSDIIKELENRYGKEKNFKVIDTIGETIDQRDYRPSDCCDDCIRTSDWQGKYFRDAILKIAVNYNEVTNSYSTTFDITNNICTVRSGYVDRFVIGVNAEYEFNGKVVDVYRYGAGLVVEPNEDEDIRKLSDRIYVPSRLNIEYKVGMKVIVYYNGKVDTEVWPARVDVLDVLINSND